MAMFKTEGAALAKGKNALCYDRENLVNLLSCTIGIHQNEDLTIDIYGGIGGVLTESNSALVDAFGNENIPIVLTDVSGNIRTLDVHNKVVFLSLPNGTGKQGYNLFGFAPNGDVFAGKAKSGIIRCSNGNIYALDPRKKFDALPKDVKLCRIFGATSSNTRRRGRRYILPEQKVLQ